MKTGWSKILLYEIRKEMKWNQLEANWNQIPSWQVHSDAWLWQHRFQWRFHWNEPQWPNEEKMATRTHAGASGAPQVWTRFNYGRFISKIERHRNAEQTMSTNCLAHPLRARGRKRIKRATLSPLYKALLPVFMPTFGLVNPRIERLDSLDKPSDQRPAQQINQTMLEKLQGLHSLFKVHVWMPWPKI